MQTINTTRFLVNFYVYYKDLLMRKCFIDV